MKTPAAIGLSAFLALFALPFAACGLGATGLIYYAVISWVDVSGWQETPARILTVEVNAGDDGDSTSTVATYEYEWSGERYTGDRVSLYFASDNIGAFQQRVATELTEHQKSGQPFRCFVDASDPSQSILYRDLRWKMLSFLSVFGTMFGTVGLGLLFATLTSFPGQREEARLRRLHPAERWRWKPEWSDEFVRGEGSSRWFLGLAGYWLTAALPGGIGAVNAIAQGNVLSVFGLIIPGIAFLITRSAIRAELRRQMFGESRVHLDRFPAITGGQMSGVLRIENDVDPRAIWHLTLTCTTTTGSGEDSTEDTAFESSQTIEGTQHSTGWGQSEVPFEFVIPYTAPQTDLEGNSQAVWKLTVKSDGTEREYSDKFTLPVFRTSESSRKFRSEQDSARDQSRLEKRLDNVFPDKALTDARLQIREQANGTVTVIAPPARYIKVAAVMGGFVLFWDAICLVLWNVDAPMLFPIAFSLGGLLITYWWLGILLQSTSLEIGTHEITFRNGWPGTAREYCVPIDDIRDVSISSNMSVGNTQYPNVRIHLSSGEQMTVMSLIRSRAAADRLVERIMEALVRD